MITFHLQGPLEETWSAENLFNWETVDWKYRSETNAGFSAKPLVRHER